MSIVIIVAILAGIVLGVVWQWRIAGLIFTSVGIGLIAGACAADWSGTKSLFSSFNAFVLVSLNYGGFFLIVIFPIILSALGAFLIKRYVFPKRR
jgi:hypothetical protein